MGSIGIAAWTAGLAFVGLITKGWTSGALGVRGIVVFLMLGVGAWVGLSYIAWGRDYVTTVLAVIDIALCLRFSKVMSESLRATPGLLTALRTFGSAVHARRSRASEC